MKNLIDNIISKYDGIIIKKNNDVYYLQFYKNNQSHSVLSNKSFDDLIEKTKAHFDKYVLKI